MKELSIEKKAKAYDEALERAKLILSGEGVPALPGMNMIEAIFPELKESEDEKVRKKLINIVKKLYEQGGYALHKWEADEILAWLEKQSEPIDKIGRKFNIGDIVQYITDSTDRRKIKEIDTLCNMYHTDSSPIMFEIEDEWKVVVNAEDIEQEPAWSEEDENRVDQICEDLKCGLINFYANKNVKGLHFDEIIESNIDWLKNKLKFLKPQSTWKPSDEQMKALGVATNISNVPEKEYIELEKLYQDLKKLREG